MNTYISNGETITTPPDSFFIPEENIWVIKNQPITRGDSTFYVQQKTNCPNCWQYSYDNSYWVNWFCSETGASNLIIHNNANTILGIYYNRGLGAYTDSLYFKTTPQTQGFIPTIIGDSVLWRAIPKDSIFYNGEWIDLNDTLQTAKDSIFYGGEWITDYSSIIINDTSILNELDTIFINGEKFGNGDSIIVDPSETNELDTITINGVPLVNGSSIIVDP